MAPVKNVPTGTITLPPPALLQASIAFLNALVFSVVPSAIAPYFVIKNSLFEKTGALICFLISSISFNGSAEDVQTFARSCPIAEETINMASKHTAMRLVMDDFPVIFFKIGDFSF
jgi:hypothetical protein